MSYLRAYLPAQFLQSEISFQPVFNQIPNGNKFEIKSCYFSSSLAIPSSFMISTSMPAANLQGERGQWSLHMPRPSHHTAFFARSGKI
jgi:hypothetical protein